MNQLHCGSKVIKATAMTIKNVTITMIASTDFFMMHNSTVAEPNLRHTDNSRAFKEQMNLRLTAEELGKTYMFTAGK